MGCGTVPEENKPMRQEPLLRSAREQERIDTDEENAQKRARRTETETETEVEEEEEEERVIHDTSSSTFSVRAHHHHRRVDAAPFFKTLFPFFPVLSLSFPSLFPH